MKDCNKDIEKYHDDNVKLPQKKRSELTARRDANRDRVKNGLKANEKPTPSEFVTQGSHAIGTTIQEPDNAHDIDDGVVFKADELVGPNGGVISALDARQMVRDAVDDGSFKTKPEIKMNCVRVVYDDGPHVDIPVYRRKADGTNELASSDWRESNPEGVNQWFKDCQARKIGEGAPEQMKTNIRLLKSFCKNRRSYSLPSGFVISVLINEAYQIFDERFDRSFRQVLTAVYNRLCGSLIVRHPVVDEYLTDGNDDPKTRQLRELLKTAIEDLKVLDKSSCRRSEALKAWKKVFNTDCFDNAICEAEENEKQKAHYACASLVYTPKPWGS